MLGFSWTRSFTGSPDAERHVTRGALTKRSSPDVTQTEISRLCNISLTDPSCASSADAGGKTLGTAAAANPMAEILRKFLREIRFIRAS
jgi:hypothetical protein